jgi:hypothetical protein
MVADPTTVLDWRTNNRYVQALPDSPGRWAIVRTPPGWLYQCFSNDGFPPSTGWTANIHENPNNPYQNPPGGGNPFQNAYSPGPTVVNMSVGFGASLECPLFTIEATESPTMAPTAAPQSNATGSPTSHSTDGASTTSLTGIIVGVIGGTVAVAAILLLFRVYSNNLKTKQSPSNTVWMFNDAYADGSGANQHMASVMCPRVPGLNTAYFDREVAFPTVMISYQSNSTGDGLGKSFMWGMANSLKDRGITSFNGYMIKGGQMWQKAWFGLLPEAECVILMMSKSFFQSRPCIDELEAAIAQRKPIIPVFLENVDISGHFLGESESDVLSANFIQLHIGNAIPPVDQGLFQTPTSDVQFDREHWESNMDLVVDRIIEICGDIVITNPHSVDAVNANASAAVARQKFAMKTSELEEPLLPLEG